MSQRGASATEQIEVVVGDILRDIRGVLPGLLDSSRAFAFEFDKQIRNGMIGLVNIRSWDDHHEPIHHENCDEPEIQLRRLEQFLVKTLPSKLVHTFQGHIITRVTIKDKTLGFSFVTDRQRLYDWRRRVET